MANRSRFAQRLRASKGWQQAYKRVRAASGAIAAVLGAVAGTALFTPTPWAHGSVQVVIWVTAAVALVVCLMAIAIGSGASVDEQPQIVPIPGRPGTDDYMSASDEDVEQARKRAGLSSPPTVPEARTRRRPAS
jgi:hypothetical protein